MWAGGFVWFDVVGCIVRSSSIVVHVFGNSSMVLVNSGSMNGTSSERFWAKNYLKRCGL